MSSGSAPRHEGDFPLKFEDPAYPDGVRPSWLKVTARVAFGAGLTVALTASSCQYSVRPTPPRLAVVAEDAVGSLSAADPPVLRATVTQAGNPLQGADVRFIALDEQGEALANIGFAETDAQGVAVATLADAAQSALDDIFAAVSYEVDVDTPDRAQGGEATATLRVEP